MTTVSIIRKPMPRRPPAKRLFYGMAGSPLAQVNEPTTEPALFVPKRRGPKPKHGYVMTPTERKRNQYERQREPEKRQLVAKILKIMKRQMTVPAHDEDLKRRSSTDKVNEDNRIRLRRLRDELTLLSVIDLRKYAKTLKEAPDSHGRLHNERSGEGPRINGMSEMERIIAAQERGEHGGRARPQGHGPTSYEPADPADVKTSIYNPLQKTESEKPIDEAIEQLVEEFRQTLASPDVSAVKCPWCPVMPTSPTGAENHFNAEYTKGKNQKVYIEELEAYNEEAYSPVPTAILDAAKESLQNNLHFTGINEIIKERRLADREWKRKAKDAGFKPDRGAWKTEVIT